MIQSVSTAEHKTEYLRRLSGKPYFEAVLGTHLRLFGQHPASGWAFYLLPGTAVLELRGGSAVVCGALPGGSAGEDAREELAAFPFGAAQSPDILLGYPKGAGISIAVRTLSAELIVCDEIGGFEEAEEIVRAHICGVPLLASAHAATAAELLARPGMRLLHDARCFGAYVGLSRRNGARNFDYDVLSWEAADALL